MNCQCDRCLNQNEWNTKRCTLENHGLNEGDCCFPEWNTGNCLGNDCPECPDFVNNGKADPPEPRYIGTTDCREYT